MRGARPSKRGAERWFERAPFYFAAKAAPSEENCCCEYGLLVTVRFGVALVVDLCDALKCCDAAQAEDLGRSGRRSRGGAIHALLEWSDSADHRHSVGQRLEPGRCQRRSASASETVTRLT